MKWDLFNKMVAFRDIDGSDINQEFDSLFMFIHNRYLQQNFMLGNIYYKNKTDDNKQLLDKSDALLEVASFLFYLEREIAKINKKTKKYKFYFNLNNGANTFGIDLKEYETGNKSRFIKSATVVMLKLSELTIQLPFNICTIEFRDGSYVNEKAIYNKFKNIVKNYKSTHKMKVFDKYQISIFDLDLKNGVIAEPAYDRIYM